MNFDVGTQARHAADLHFDSPNTKIPERSHDFPDAMDTKLQTPGDWLCGASSLSYSRCLW
jgi:hypothetical protein